MKRKSVSGPTCLYRFKRQKRENCQCPNPIVKREEQWSPDCESSTSHSQMAPPDNKYLMTKADELLLLQNLNEAKYRKRVISMNSIRRQIGKKTENYYPVKLLQKTYKRNWELYKLFLTYRDEHGFDEENRTLKLTEEQWKDKGYYNKYVKYLNCEISHKLLSVWEDLFTEHVLPQVYTLEVAIVTTNVNTYKLHFWQPKIGNKSSGIRSRIMQGGTSAMQSDGNSLMSVICGRLKSSAEFESLVPKIDFFGFFEALSPKSYAINWLQNASESEFNNYMTGFFNANPQILVEVQHGPRFTDSEVPETQLST